MWKVKYTYQRKGCSELRTYRQLNDKHPVLPGWVLSTINRVAGRTDGIFEVFNKTQVRRVE